MVRWPSHNERIREDELWLFGYCLRKWPDSPYDSRPPIAYSDVVDQLNERFTPLFGEYSLASVRRYIQLCRTDPKYRWPANSLKRYNQFDKEIRAYSSRHASEFGGRPERPSDVPLHRKRMSPLVAVRVLDHSPCSYSFVPYLRRADLDCRRRETRQNVGSK